MVTKKATAKKSPAATPAKKVIPETDKPRQSKPHEIVLSSNTQNAVGIFAWSKFAGEADLQELCNDLGEETVKVVQDGNMRPIEAMLYQQAKTLETMFTSLARRAANQDGLKQFQANLTLALKAQSQCRATLAALAEIKNPRPFSFVQQANIANGPQQVNNTGTQGTHPPTRAEKTKATQSDLLEHQHGNYLDTGAHSQTGRADKTLEAVGTVHRAANA